MKNVKQRLINSSMKISEILKKEELEEIKVTKTVSGKNQTPSRRLAMAKKKKSPNQVKPPVEIGKFTKSMKDLSNEILKGEY